MVALLACALAAAALMIAARAGRRTRILREEVDALSTRVAALADDLERAGRTLPPGAEDEPAARAVQGAPEAGRPRTVH